MSAEAIGWASTKDFLTHVTGGRKGTGASLVRVAQHTADLPEVRAALAAGSISLAQAGVIGGRVTTLPRDLEFRERTASALLDLVDNNGYDATDLDRCFPQVAKDLDTDGLLLATDLSKDLQERGAHGARYLSLTPDTLGGVRIKGYTSLEEAELVKTTLMTLTAPVVTEPGACGGDPTTIGQHPVRRPRTPPPPRLPRPDLRPRRPRHPRPRRPAVGRPGRGLPPAPGHRQPPPRPRHHGPDHPDHQPARTSVDRLDAHGLLPTRRNPLRRGRPTPRLRRRDHPRDPRHRRVRSSTSAAPTAWSPPASGPPWSSATTHCAFPGCTRLPIDLRRPPHHPLGRPRHHVAGQPDPALPQTPHSTSTKHPGKCTSTREPDDPSGSHHHPSTTPTGSPTHQPDHDHQWSPEVS